MPDSLAGLATHLSAAPDAIAAGTLGAHPYPHLVVERLFADGDARALLDWLLSGATWWRQERDFYSHDSCDNLEDCPLVRGDGVLSPTARGGLAKALSARFGIPLDGQYVSLCAHRMRPGHGIGVHTDDPILGTEYLRLLVTLRDGGFDDADGGHFCMMTGHEPDCVAAIARPLHNLAIAFALSEKSLHAVNDVMNGERFSLVLGFWHADQVSNAQARKADLRAERSEDGLARIDGADAFLAELKGRGAHRTPHSGASLLSHLVGVASLLSDWTCRDTVVRAGLFHSVYGTGSFHTRLYAEWERESLRALIGDEAERLAWLFSVVRFNEIYKYAGEDGFMARRRDATEPEWLSIQDIADLNLIALANALEQGDTAFEPGSLFELKQAFAKLTGYIPSNARRVVEALTA